MGRLDATAEDGVDVRFGGAQAEGAVKSPEEGNGDETGGEQKAGRRAQAGAPSVERCQGCQEQEGARPDEGEGAKGDESGVDAERLVVDGAGEVAEQVVEGEDLRAVPQRPQGDGEREGEERRGDEKGAGAAGWVSGSQIWIGNIPAFAPKPISMSTAEVKMILRSQFAAAAYISSNASVPVWL